MMLKFSKPNLNNVRKKYIYSCPMIPIFIRHELTVTPIGELFLDNKQLYTCDICHNEKVKDVQNFGKDSFSIYNK